MIKKCLAIKNPLSEQKLLADLATIAPGCYKVKSSFWSRNSRNGWLTIRRHIYEKGGTYRSIFWTSHKHHHDPLSRFTTAFCIDVAPPGKLLAYYETALTLRMLWGHNRGGEKEYQRAIKASIWMHDVLFNPNRHELINDDSEDFGKILFDDAGNIILDSSEFYCLSYGHPENADDKAAGAPGAARPH